MPILTLVGPTAVGKTAIAIALAHRIGAEIISADSRQIYRHLDIGTAKPTHEEQQAARHHLIDIIDPDTRYSAGAYVRDVHRVLDELQESETTPMIVGGAGLYIRALTGGLFEAPEIPEEVLVRIRSDMEAVPTSTLHEKLHTVDPEAAARIHPNDRQRIGRALEVHEATGTPLTTWHRTAAPESPPLPIHMVGLQRDRAELYARADARVDAMIASGLVEEVRGLLDMGYTADTEALKTFGYAEIISHFQGTLSLEEATDKIKQQTRRYAKRQMTWFRHAGPVDWITLTPTSDIDRVCDDIIGCVS